MDDQKVEEIKRYFGVVAEELKQDIAQITEGHGILRNEMGEFREEVRNEFKEVRSLIKLSYAEIEHRDRDLEQKMLTFQTRLEQLEARN